MEKELHNRPFGLSLSKATPRMIRQAHHERTKDIYVVHYLCKPQYRRTTRRENLARTSSRRDSFSRALHSV